jgi:hypothetical protein
MKTHPHIKGTFANYPPKLPKLKSKTENDGPEESKSQQTRRLKAQNSTFVSSLLRAQLPYITDEVQRRVQVKLILAHQDIVHECSKRIR